MIAPSTVLFATDRATTLDLAPNGEPMAGGVEARWHVVTESGEVRHGVTVDSRAEVGALPAGYHHLTVTTPDFAVASTLLVRPDRAFVPKAIAGSADRTWGLACNVYALRSERNWGMGDFTDLATFFTIAAKLGADSVGVNPLHALHYVDGSAASPYSPTSRFFLNPFYIDVEASPEFAKCALHGTIVSPAFRAELAASRALPHVDYDGVASRKRAAFDSLYAALLAQRKDSKRRRAFEDFVERGGERLERFARYETLTERFARDDGRYRGWLTWPEIYRKPDAPAVDAFASGERPRIDFFKYLQFLADEQLAAAVERGRAMRIGLYCDLAVGVDLNSADVWAHQDRYVLDETIGAPPDPLAWQGQNWGLPPLDAEALVQEGCATYADLLRANMAHAGALRIDHVMSLLRLFRIPQGQPASRGAYVPYPFDELVATVAIESERAECLVVGEDLGTVPDGFRDRMEREHVLSYRLLLFERSEDGTFLPPEVYPELGLATATTHDSPPLAGWIVGRDAALRAEARLIAPEEAEREAAARRIEASALLQAILRAGELDESAFQELHRALDREREVPGSFGPRERATLTEAAYRFLARTRSRFVLVQLDDALGETDQVNLPGTFHEYPNWRRKVGVGLDRIAGDARLAALARDIKERIGAASAASTIDSKPDIRRGGP